MSTDSAWAESEAPPTVHQVGHRPLVLQVQRQQRLVTQQQHGGAEQGLGHPEPLLLATAQPPSVASSDLAWAICHAWNVGYLAGIVSLTPTIGGPAFVAVCLIAVGCA